MQNLIKSIPGRVKQWSRSKKAILGLILVAAVAAMLWPKAASTKSNTMAVRRGPLAITVTQAGNIEALESQEIRSEVKGYQGTKVLSIVEEGVQVSELDVKNGRVLVELDSSEIRTRITTQDIDYQSKMAMRTEAQQGFEIQINQNTADIKAAEQKAKFALLDLEKYMGDVAAREIVAEAGVTTWQHAPIPTSPAPSLAEPPKLLSGKDPNPPASPGDAAPQIENVTPAAVTAKAPTTEEAKPPASGIPSESREPALPEPKTVTIEFSKYAKVELLGDGEAQQKLRELKDGLLLAEKEKSSNETKLAGTERLYQKGFVTKTEYETSKLEYEQVALKVQKATTAYNLFLKYEFPKAAEEMFSKYEEAVRLLERTRKESFSKLAQARAKMMSAEIQFKIVDEARKDLNDQLAKCTIRAKKPGLVTYGGSSDGVYYYGEERIREGALIRERQPIITIPDMTQMAVKVKIHESHIKKIKTGMKARIRVDAFPDKVLMGEVIKVGILPDSQNRWMNPEMKVYLTTVKITGVNDWLKPGMSGKVEILVNELKDVLQVPIQAVMPEDKDKVCYVMGYRKAERRTVEIGEYSDEWIEIKKGLKEGEKVLLRAPDVTDGGDKARTNSMRSGSEEKSPAPATAPVKLK